MAGRNQHYIPRFLLRAFEIPGSDRRVWYFGRGQPPRMRAVRKTASEDFFYSGPVQGGEPSLDAAISGRESDDLSKCFNAVRSMAPGESVGATDAALLAAHLTQRTFHVRSTLTDGATGILEKWRQAFDLGDGAVDSLMGLGGTEPTDEFQDLVMKRITNLPEFAAGLSFLTQRTRSRVVYLMAKEQSDAISQVMRDALGKFLPSDLALAVSNSHRSALKGQIAEVCGFEAVLRTFDWTVERGPEQGAILPDCVAIALGPDGQAGNHMLIGADETEVLVLAVSPRLLLVGCRPGCTLPEGFDYNFEAACLSHAFFLAPRNDDDTARFHAIVGSKLQPSLEESVEAAARESLPSSVKKAEPTVTLPPQRGMDQAPPLRHDSLLSLLSLHENEDKRSPGLAQNMLASILTAFNMFWPLGRLDGITASSDYAGTLTSVDRGGEPAAPPTTVLPEFGSGVAQTVAVKRSGMIKGHIVLSSSVLDSLLSENADMRDWGLNVLASQLAGVALMELSECSQQDTLLEQAPTTALDSWLHSIVGCAPASYSTSWMAAPIGNPARTASIFREQLVESTNRLSTVVMEQRRSYSEQGNLEALLGFVLPSVERVLIAAANLLGHCQGSGEPPSGTTDALGNALSGAGLNNWLRVYGDDLARFHSRLGQGEPLVEVLAFNIHAERLLWSIGMFPRESPTGVWVDVPPFTNDGTEWMRMLGDPGFALGSANSSQTLSLD